MASSSSAWKSSRRQRERMVGSSRPGAWLTRKNKLLGGGSSSILSRALAAGRFELVDSVDDHHPPRRHAPGSADMNSPSSRTWSTLMLRARLPVFSFTSRSSQRMSGWLPASTSLTDRMLVGGVEAGQLERRPGGLGEHAPRRGLGEARLAHALGPGEQPGMMKLARRPGARELLDGAVLAEDHGSKSAMASSRRCGDFVRQARTRRSAGPAPALPQRSCGRPARPCDDSRRRGRRCGRLTAVARPGPLRCPRRERAPRCGREGARRCRNRGSPAPLDPEAARSALIGERAIEEAVGQHPVDPRPAPAGSSCRHGRRGPPRTAGPPLRRSSASSPPPSSSSRIASAPWLPPGSRVTRTSRPRALSASASARTWVDLPTPSPPSRRDELAAFRHAIPSN